MVEFGVQIPMAPIFHFAKNREMRVEAKGRPTTGLRGGLAPLPGRLSTLAQSNGATMATAVKKRRSASSVSVDTNVRCQRVYPTEDTKRTVAELQSVGIKLSKEQAIHLARVLLVVAQDWDEIDITAYRFDKRRDDGLYRLTVTSQVEENDAE